MIWINLLRFLKPVRFFLLTIIVFCYLPAFLYMHFVLMLIVFSTIGFRQFVIINNGKKYFSYDRVKYKNLNLFEKYGCAFCTYGNGVFMMGGAVFEFIKSRDYLYESSHLFKKFLLIILLNAFYFGSILSVYFYIYTCEKIARIPAVVVPENLHKKRVGWQRLMAKMSWTLDISINALTRVESMWCPIRHIDCEGHVYPQHNYEFYTIDEHEKIRTNLKEYGYSMKDMGPKCSNCSRSG